MKFNLKSYIASLPLFFIIGAVQLVHAHDREFFDDVASCNIEKVEEKLRTSKEKLRVSRLRTSNPVESAAPAEAEPFDINAVDEQNRSALYVAVEQASCEEVIELLLKNKAIINLAHPARSIIELLNVDLPQRLQGEWSRLSYFHDIAIRELNQIDPAMMALEDRLARLQADHRRLSTESERRQHHDLYPFYRPTGLSPHFPFFGPPARNPQYANENLRILEQQKGETETELDELNFQQAETHYRLLSLKKSIQANELKTQIVPKIKNKLEIYLFREHYSQESTSFMPGVLLDIIQSHH